MKLTVRAKKRLILLAVLVVTIPSGIWVLLEIRVSQREENGRIARQDAAIAIENGDWEEALAKMSVAASNAPGDVGLVIELADLRSRVTAVNNQHIPTALRYYRDALAKSRSTPSVDSEELQVSALKGCADMELAMGQLARAAASCEQILEIDPENTHALRMLVTVNTVVGDYLPESTVLARRDGRSLAQWLDACRAASDSSALRWRLELLNQNPESVERVIGLITTLREGGAESRQEREGIEPETVEMLIRGMAEENDLLKTSLPVFLAEEKLRQGDRQGAIEVMRDFDESKINDPRLDLVVVYIFDRLDSPEFLSRRDEILSEMSSKPSPSSEIALELARRYWANDRLSTSLEVLDAYQATDADDSRIPIMGAIVASQLDDPSRDSWVEILEAESRRSDLSLASRDQVRVTLQLLEIARAETLDRKKITEQLANMGRWFQDPIMMTLAGDLAARANLDSAAVSAYESALQVIGEASIVSRRLVIALTRENRPAAAFRRAAEFANSNQTLAALLILGDAWIRLEKSGIDAIDILPEFDSFNRPIDLLQQIASALEANSESTRPLVPLLIRAEMLEGNEPQAFSRLQGLIGSAESDDDLAAAISLAIQMGLKLPAGDLQSIMERSEDPRVLTRSTILAAQAIAGDEGADKAFEVLRARLKIELDEDLRRNLAMAMYRLAAGDPSRLEEVGQVLGQMEATPNGMLVRLEIAIDTENRAAASEIVIEIRREFGSPSVQASLAEGLFTLAFDADDSESVANALASADEVFSSGERSPRLASVLAKLYLAGSNPQRPRATEVLIESVNRHPNHLANLLFLVSELQTAGRFSFAADYLDSAVKRQRSASPAQRRYLVALLGRQGDSDETKSSVCAIAEETGEVVDLLACMRLHYELGDIAAGDAVLDRIAATEVAYIEVDLALADRLIREGDLEAGLEFLEQTRSFERDIDRATEVANRLMNATLFDRAINRLAMNPAEAFDSPRAQLLLAICETQIPNGDPALCQAMLDRVLELEPDDVNYVTQVLNLMIANEQLRPAVPRYVPRLARIAPTLSELISIRIEVQETRGDVGKVRELATRVQAVIDQRPDILAAWSVWFDLESSLYAAAVYLGEAEEIIRIREEMKESRSRFLQRFPKNSLALSRAVGLSLQIGDLEEAELLARELSEATAEDRKLGTMLPLARVMFAAGDWDGALTTIVPFENQILDPDVEVPVAFQILVRSKLALGYSTEAFANFRTKLAASGPLDSDQEALWFLAVGDDRLSGSARSEGVRVFEESLGSQVARPDVQLAMIEVLLNSARDTEDEELAGEIDRRIAAIDTSGDQCREIQLQGLIFESETIREPEEAILNAGRWIAEVPRSFIEKISKAPELGGEMQEELALCYRSIVILLNNFLARFGEVIIEGTVSMTDVSEIAAVAAVAEKDLAALQRFNPDVLDTRATYMLAIGNLAEAMELATTAVAERPGSTRLRLTLAKALLAMGRSDAASQAASLAVQLERVKLDPDPDLLRELQQIRDSN